MTAGYDMSWVVVVKFWGMLVQGGKGSWWSYCCVMKWGLQMMDDWKRQDKAMFAGHNINLAFVDGVPIF